LHTISIGSRGTLSSSSTPTGIAGWRRFRPLTSAPIRPSDRRRTWAAAVRDRYARGLRRERAGMVWRHRHAAAAMPLPWPTARWERHSHAHWAPVTHLHFAFAPPRQGPGTVRPGSPGSGPPPAVILTAAVPVQRRFAVRAEPPRRRLTVDVVRRLSVESMRREHESFSVIHARRIQSHSIERNERHTLAREISLRVRRVEQPAPRRAPIESGRAAATLRHAVRDAAPQVRPALAPPREAEPPLAPERPPAPPVNLDAITESVMRQIDRRLVAQRERTGRF
jgi:hypothetical protein